VSDFWKVPASILFAIVISLFCWFFAVKAMYGQEVELRHYRRADLMDDPSGQLRTEQHFLIAADGRAAVVYMGGYEGAPAPEVTVGVSGLFYPRGESTVCFVPDDYEGNNDELRADLMDGREICFTYNSEADTFHPINDSSMVLENCGEPHGQTRNPNLRGT
jgi:hypothetical protein